jgi:predicted dehydrogenase/nucleoside-diphosphate-sugar epimerase
MAGNRVALIGAGRIAHTHLDALKNTPNVMVSAIIDPNLMAAEAMAKTAGHGAKAFASIDEAIAAKAFDCAHVLVPPNLHAAIGRQILGAGIPCLMEKPVGVTSAEANELLALAMQKNVAFGVNQNYIFHPAYAKFKRDLDAGKYGRLRFVSLLAAVPLPQLETKQFGHWMFERPSNIILEQIVHPLSQIVHLIGRSEIVASVSPAPVEVAPGVFFHKSFDVTLKGAQCNAQLHMAFGENFPAWQLTAICDDATVIVDGGKNTVQFIGRTRFLEAGDNAVTLLKSGVALMTQGISGISTYLASQLKLVRRADSFYRSLEANVQDFHSNLAAGRAPTSDGAFGAHLVDLCADIASKANVSDAVVANPRTLVATDQPVPNYDVAVFGGTGFIGKFVVRQLLDAGYSVGVIGRSVRGLPDFFNDPRVSILRGDVTRRADIERGIGAAKYVINLAHGGGGATRAAIVDVLTGSARMVGEVCLEKQVKRLVFISTIAALYLGDGGERITAQTGFDTNSDERADYSFAKAEAERVLLEMHKTQGLPVTIQRPGVVVGDGASPFHSGLGMFNNDQHCLGWNDGRNPLPFVLVEDTASAIVAALKADDSVHGRADNIVGGVRLSARAYLEELKGILGRPLKFHPQSIWVQQGIEIGKWLIKKAGGKNVPKPSVRDLLSRGMPAQFDTSETERALNWAPVKDHAVFIERGIKIPARALLD